MPVPRRRDRLIGPNRSRFVPVLGHRGEPDGGTLAWRKAGQRDRGASLLALYDFNMPWEVILYHQQRFSNARRLRRVVRVRLGTGGWACGTGTDEKDSRACGENLMKLAHWTPGLNGGPIGSTSSVG